MRLDTNTNIKEASFSAKIIRADGTVEDLGVISYYHKNIFKRMFYSLKKFFDK